MTAMDSTIKALILTATASLAALRAATTDLRNGGGAAALKRGIEEADVLSGSVARLDKMIDTLGPAPEPAPLAVARPSVDIAEVREVLDRAAVLAQSGPCKRCGGVAMTRPEDD